MNGPMDAFLNAFPLVLTPSVLGAVSLGTVIGLIFGAIPGLTYTMALSLVLPMTFGAAAMPAIALMVGTYVGGMTGGSVSAILIGVPGTPSAAATVLDGYPMRKNGKASLALGLAVISSTVGGLISLFIMVVSVNIVSRLAIKFGPAEIFALVVFGMSTICGLAEKSLTRGLIAGVLGLMLMTIGLDDITGDQRLTFGTVTFQQGVNLVVAMIGLFAVPHIIQTFAIYRAGLQKHADPQDARLELPSLALMQRTLGVMLRSSLIGTVIGAIPGASGPIGAFLAYDNARRFSKERARFGKGIEEGVIAPETANNAVSGGTFIPLLEPRHSRRSGHRRHPLRSADPRPVPRADAVPRAPDRDLRPLSRDHPLLCRHPGGAIARHPPVRRRSCWCRRISCRSPSWSCA